MKVCELHQPRKTVVLTPVFHISRAWVPLSTWRWGPRSASSDEEIAMRVTLPACLV